MKLSLVVPCYNEADNADMVERHLLPVVAQLAAAGSVDVVFVDDGSRDATAEVFEALAARATRPSIDVRVVRHGRNRGLGAALRTGFAAATGDVIVTTDSDATYRFDEIPALLACLTDDVDLVTASPYHPQGEVAGVPPHRLVLSRGSSFLYRRLVRADLHTYTALFRAYRRQVVETVPFTSDGFLAGTELLVNAIGAGYRVAEYPTTLHSRVAGVSKARLLRTIKAHLAYQGRILLAACGLITAPWQRPASTPDTTVGAAAPAVGRVSRDAR